MYLSAERIAVVDKAVQDTFDQSSIAWQAIPHWDTGDPGRLRVRSDYAHAEPTKGNDLSAPLGGASLELEPHYVRFAVTVAQAIAPAPDALLAAVIARTVELAAKVDSKVIDVLRAGAKDPVNVQAPTGTTAQIQMLLNALIDARAQLEKSGYRAPSCLLTDTEGLKALNYLQSGLSDFQSLLDAANINSVYRVDQLRSDEEPTPAGGTDPAEGTDPASGNGQFKGRLLLLGRRQRIAHGGAAAASPGEEPVDLAVSVPPSLEIVGETDTNTIEMAVRIRFTPRLTDDFGVVNVV